MLENRFYQVALTATNLCLLNLVWLVACLPVVTIMPATAAVFGVVKEWHEGKPSAILAPFARQFGRHFVPSSVLGTAWLLAGAAIIGNNLLIPELDFRIRFIAFAANALLTLVYLFTTMFLFPLLVTYRLTWGQLIKYSFLISMARYAVTLRCLVFLASAITLVYFFPPFLLVAGSTACYAVYQLCRDVFDALEHKR